LPTQEPIGLLVAVVRRRIKQAVSTMVREHDLSPQQFWTLVAIANNEGASLRELAELQRMDQPTACRVVAALARRRLVHSGADPADRRRSRLVLTPSGRSLAERLAPIAAAVRSAVEAGLTPSERTAVVAGLRKVIANLENSEAGRGKGRLVAGIDNR
jgi:MarR family transcriptional regulator, transcriptional regulator for hemolysin